MGLRIVKRDSCPFWKMCCFYLAAVVLALVIGAVVLMFLGVDPLAYYTRMFTMGTIGNKIAYKTFENSGNNKRFGVEFSVFIILYNLCCICLNLVCAVVIKLDDFCF